MTWGFRLRTAEIQHGHSPFRHAATCRFTARCLSVSTEHRLASDLVGATVNIPCMGLVEEAGRWILIAVVLAGCASETPVAVTSTVTRTVTATPGATGQSWGGAGDYTYAVGTTPHGGLDEAIPPGRYRVTLDAGNPLSVGMWARCSDVVCTPAGESVVDSGGVQGGGVHVIEVAGSDRAVFVSGLLLTPAV